MQKTSAKIITALLLAALSLTLVPLAFASTGNILINDTVSPQDLPITPVPAGGNITLNFGDVTFSGSQFYLLLSQDGLSQVSGGDIRYTPLFSVASVGGAVTDIPADPSFPGQWRIGNGWVNGTIPTNIAGGTYYIKAFDGATTALAVTQGFTVSASFHVIPVAGSAGTAIILSGNAFPANSLVNLTYLNEVSGPPYVTIQNLTQTNSLGQFNYSMAAPDLKIAPGAGVTSPAPTGVFEFEATLNATTPVVYTATYTETERGLLQIGKPRSAFYFNATAPGVYGNMSRFDLTPTEGLSTISVGVGDTFRIAGNSFYPGVVSMKWDNSIDLATTLAGNTANNTGFFNATFTVPTTGLGSHNITMTDSGLQIFVVFVNVVQSITVTPTTGPIGTSVTVNGFGFPAPTTTDVYNVTMVIFRTGDTPSTVIRAAALTDANGQFTASFNIPTTAGGANTIRATANGTGTTADATFTVTASFTVSPTEFYANSTSAVTATGTGFNIAKTYFVAIDNLFSPFTNTTNGLLPGQSGNSLGKITFVFIQAGFQPGLHVVALYEAGSSTYSPVANATFTVLGTAQNVTADNATATMLNAINETVTTINTKLDLMNATILSCCNNITTVLTNQGTIISFVTGINATVVGISNNVATIATSIGNLQTTVNAINATVIAINGNIATIATSMGTLQITVNAINATVNSISGTEATINTSIGTLTTTVNAIGANVTSIKGTVATLQTTLGTVQTTVNSINANITSISSGLATVQTSVGTITTTLTSINGKIDSITGTVGSISSTVSSISSAVSGIATISTTVGSIQTSLSSIGTVVTRIDGNVATIVTDLGTLQGTVTSIQGDVATIKTNVGTIQADVGTLQTGVDNVPGQVNVPIWIAVVLALIAAIAAIASLLLVRRKIAG